jgi:hypothetical protein
MFDVNVTNKCDIIYVDRSHGGSPLVSMGRVASKNSKKIGVEFPCGNVVYFNTKGKEITNSRFPAYLVNKDRFDALKNQMEVQVKQRNAEAALRYAYELGVKNPQDTIKALEIAIRVLQEL